MPTDDPSRRAGATTRGRSRPPQQAASASLGHLLTNTDNQQLMVLDTDITPASRVPSAATSESSDHEPDTQRQRTSLIPVHSATAANPRAAAWETEQSARTSALEQRLNATDRWCQFLNTQLSALRTTAERSTAAIAALTSEVATLKTALEQFRTAPPPAAACPSAAPVSPSALPTAPPAAAPPAAAPPTAPPATATTAPPTAPPAAATQRHGNQATRLRRHRQRNAASGQPPSQNTSSSPPLRTQQPPSLSLQERLAYKKQFLLVGPPGAVGTATSLRQFVSTLITQRMPSAQPVISDATRLGDQSTHSRVYFTVDTLEQADAIVRWRHLLKNSGYSLQDVLTPAQQLEKTALWPQYVSSLAAGKRAQFNGSRLMVDGCRIFLTA